MEHYLRWTLSAFVVLIVFAILALNGAFSRPGFWTTSGDPAIDKWFGDQKIPGTRSLCCSTADGTFVEEDIREGHYWARWEGSHGEWIPVPERAIINEPNKWGRPAVWWGTDEGGYIYIRCFAPGAKG